VENGRLKSRYVTEYHAKCRTPKGRAELQSLGFGPVADENLVRSATFPHCNSQASGKMWTVDMWIVRL